MPDELRSSFSGFGKRTSRTVWKSGCHPIWCQVRNLNHSGSAGSSIYNPLVDPCLASQLFTVSELQLVDQNEHEDLPPVTNRKWVGTNTVRAYTRQVEGMNSSLRGYYDLVEMSRTRWIDSSGDNRNDDGDEVRAKVGRMAANGFSLRVE